MTAIQQKMDFNSYIYRPAAVPALKAVAPEAINTAKPEVYVRQRGISLSAYSAHLSKQGISMGRNRLFKWLRDNGYLSKQKSTWNMPLQKHIASGLFQVKETFVIIADEQVPKYSPLITPSGMKAIDQKLKASYSAIAKAN